MFVVPRKGKGYGRRGGDRANLPGVGIDDGVVRVGMRVGMRQARRFLLWWWRRRRQRRRVLLLQRDRVLIRNAVRVLVVRMMVRMVVRMVVRVMSREIRG